MACAIASISAYIVRSLSVARDLDEVEDLYLYRRLGGLEAAAAGRSAEDELLDIYTDDEVKRALVQRAAE